MQKYKLAVFVGRFQPVHKGHIAGFCRGLEVADNILILIGSDDAPRGIRNPFTTSERKQMINAALESITDLSRVHLQGIFDTIYSDPSWVVRVETAIKDAFPDISPSDIVFFGFPKDEKTAEYLNYFKHMSREDGCLHTLPDGSILNATDIRTKMFVDPDRLENPTELCPSTTQFIFNWMETEREAYSTLIEEYEKGLGYEQIFTTYPQNFALNFLTTDAVVIQSGHVLLVKRKFAPGRGLWALPGGHLQPNLTFKQNLIKELQEETCIKVPERVLANSIFLEKVFDHPERSLRGRLTMKNARTVTMAYGIKLRDSDSLPKVKGADDAESAWWFTFEEVGRMRSQLFEDHYDIIRYFLDRVE